MRTIRVVTTAVLTVTWWSPLGEKGGEEGRDLDEALQRLLGLQPVSSSSSRRWLLPSVQLLGRVRLFATPWTAERQASLSITNSRSLPNLMSIKLVMPSNHPVLCHPLLLLPSICPSIRVFSNESVLRIRWPKYWRFSFSQQQSFQ